MLDQEIWAVPYEHTLRNTAEELQEVFPGLIGMHTTTGYQMLGMHYVPAISWHRIGSYAID